jgi:dienelactone hydrolase
MRRLQMVVLAVVATATATVARGQATAPDTVVVHSGSITLRALVWRPSGRGPFPAILINHGSGRTPEQLAQRGPYENQAETLGPVFAHHGYVAFFLFRRGVGLSADQGESAVNLMSREADANGQDARNALQLRLLDRDLRDAEEGIAVLRTLPEVDPRRIAIVGHSFGASLSILQAAREPGVRAVVLFSTAGYSWDRSPPLRARLLDALPRVRAPLFIIHAENDYTLNPGKALDARLTKLGVPHLLRIYPPIGKTPDDGHDFPVSGVSIWSPDVFAFLDERARK